MSFIVGGLILGLAVVIAARIYLAKKTNSQPSPNVSSLAKSLLVERSKSDIILNAVDDAIVVADDQNIIQLFNPAAAKLTGWKQDEAVNLDYRNVLQLVDNKNARYAEDQNPFNRALKEGKNMRDGNAILVSHTNERIPITISASPLVDQKGNVTGVVAIFSNVSAQRKEERQRAEFISTASHEMRTPVAAIEGYLALAMNDKVSKIDAKAREYLEKAHYSTQHLGKLFQDLLTSAKAEDGRLSNNPSVVEMGTFLEQLAEDLRFAAEKKSLLIEFLVGTSGEIVDARRDVNSKVVQPLYYAHVDPDRLREVITNLFDNAVKYTEAGKISIGLTGNNEIVQFYIRDTGAGIPTDDIPHLFQKFYRVNNTLTRTIGGTGLGLFISRKIIELYNGRIWVESQWGKGSTFFINLPRLSTHKASELQAAEASRPSIELSTTTTTP